MIILLILIIQTYGRNLQGGTPQKKGEKWDQSNQALDQIFEHLANNLTQQQEEELELIEGYIFNEGVLYYNQATQEEKQKIFLSLIGMVGELEKENEQEHSKLEKDIQYFSQLNITDKNIVMTKISQNLDKTLIDSSKEFNSKVVLQIIKKEIENFQSNPDRSTNATWDILEYKMIQEKNEQELMEIEYQIQEFLDQGLSIEKIREKLTEFIDYFFANSTLLDDNNNSIDEIINDVKQQEEQSQPTQEMKQYRQKVRELIRELLKQGKTEEEIQKEVDDYLSKNGVNDLSDEERNLIKLIIQKEIMRNKRQQDYLNDDETKITFKNQNNMYYIYLGIFTLILLISLVVFLIRRQKMKQNQRKQIGFRIQDNAQDVEQME
ncbi:unnamed protein product [Paramecium pentaurelia]|uniref:Transmembrane protein n=1 Tax=Paramecium pentaurelia TaxID=43138 RepID=A0A8S1TID0_9CILI|nr:unnamed protein product [Paramecium pentaurelia]